MASWMVHLRVADAFLDRIEGLSHREFVVGNIGPDCSEKTPDGRFDPPSNITHWTPDGHKADIEFDRFFSETVENPSEITPRSSFLLGYYVHLLTDVLWTKMIFRPTKYRFSEEYYRDPFAFLPRVREEWFALDHCFVRDNPDFRSLSILSGAGPFPNVYFEYYSHSAFDNQIENISRFYNEYSGGYADSFKYITCQRMDDFITEAAKIIAEELSCKGIKLI